MIKLIININSENVRRIISTGQIISIRKIAAYLKIVSLKPNMILAQIDISDIFLDIKNEILEKLSNMVHYMNIHTSLMKLKKAT